MKNTLKHRENWPDLAILVLHQAHRQHTSLSSLSLALGHAHNYLSQQLKSGNPRISLLLQLSELLNINLLDPYFSQLPTGLQRTYREKHVQQQLDDMRLQLLRITEERDRYWDALKNRG